jgi:SAM-dependent methyltransferase
VTLLPVRFQDFDPGEEKFDIVVSSSSINHLDEQACSTILSKSVSRDLYLGLFRRLRSFLNPGAVVVIYCCSRYNVFQLLGVTNPFNKNIEWGKHQDPSVWKDLLLEAGFAEPVIRWHSFNSLGAPGRLLLSNRLAAYFFTSAFYLTVRNP